MNAFYISVTEGRRLPSRVAADRASGCFDVTVLDALALVLCLRRWRVVHEPNLHNHCLAFASERSVDGNIGKLPLFLTFFRTPSSVLLTDAPLMHVSITLLVLMHEAEPRAPATPNTIAHTKAYGASVRWRLGVLPVCRSRILVPSHFFHFITHRAAAAPRVRAL